MFNPYWLMFWLALSVSAVGFGVMAFALTKKNSDMAIGGGLLWALTFLCALAIIDQIPKWPGGL